MTQLPEAGAAGGPTAAPDAAALQESRLAATWRRLRTWPKVLASWLGRVAVAAGLVVSTFLLLREFAPAMIADRVRAAERLVMVTSGLRAPVPPGIVYMGAPQVFTRERLVNDRFEQANWLRVKLELTLPLEQRRNFQTPGRVNSSEAEGRIGAGVGGAPADGTAGAADAARPSLDPKKAFEHALAYRQLLRNELLDVQLDDGHDLDGNSLYRFKFDAVALPWADFSADPGSAVFIVTAKRPTFGVPNPAGSTSEPDKPSGDERALQQAIHDDVMLLRDFRREMQVFLDNIIRDRTATFDVASRLANAVDPKEDLALERFLRERMIFSFVDMLRRRQPKPEDAPETSTADACPAVPCPAFDALAKMAGVRYRAEKPSAEFDDPAVARSFYDAVEVAHAVNLLQWPRVGGQRAYQGDCRRFESDSPPQKRIESPLFWIAEDEERQSDGQDGKSGQHQGSSEECRVTPYEDPERKRAMLRLIAVIEAMDAFATRANVLLPEFTEADPTSRRKALLDTFGKVLPTRDDLESLERATQLAHQWNRQFVTEESGALPGEVMAQLSPDFYAPVRNRDCEPHRNLASVDAMLAYGKCIFLYQTDLKVANAMTRFVHDRMTRYSDTYEGHELRVLDYLDLELDENSCRQATCRIVVKPSKERPSPMPQGSPTADRQLLGAQGVTPAATTEGAVQLEKKVTTGAFEALASTGDGTRECGELHVDGWTEASAYMPGVVDAVIKRLTIQADAATERNQDLGLEVATACRLAEWLNTRRSDLGVYSVDPRIEGEVRDWRRVIAAAAEGKLGEIAMGGSLREAEAGVQLEPAIVGFGTIRRDDATNGSRNPDEARFGWVVRPVRQVDGDWAPATQRLAAVLSIPSWWSQIEFEIVGCWLTPGQHRDRLGELSKTGELKRACEDVGAMPLNFVVRLPRHVEEAIDRFNFDFIKAPYFSNAVHGPTQQPQALEVGRKGSLVLAGARLWRGTVVTLGGQVANRILVLPDMKGVIAEFECVRPYPGQEGPSRNGFVQVWTAEGATSRIPVGMNAFSPTGDETPCYAQ